MTSDLSDFGDTINALRHAHDDPLLGKKIFTYAPSAKKNERFLIKMEIRRLAQPVQRVIDLRDIFGSRCEAIQKQQRMHYLDPVGSEVFDQELARYRGHYCRGVYEFVIQDAAQRAQREEEPELEAPLELKFNQIYQRSEERVYLATKVKLGFCDDAEDGTAKTWVSATTTDLSPRGAAIKVAFKDFRPTSYVDVYFEALQQEYGLLPPMHLRYRRLRSKKSGQQIYLYVLLEQGLNPQAEDQIQPLIQQSLRLHKRRNRVAVDNIEDAIWVKMHEQFFAGNVSALPVFVACRDGSNRVEACIFDKGQNNLLPYLTLQGQPTFLATLFEHSAIEPPSEHAMSSQRLFVLRLRTREGNSLLAVIPFAQALRNRHYAQWIEQAGEGMRLLQLDWAKIDAGKHGHLPSSLPDEAGEVFASMNQPLPEQLIVSLSTLTHMCAIHDLTQSMPDLGLGEALKRVEDTSKVADPRIGLQATHRIYASVPPIHERRSEPRYREAGEALVRRHREPDKPMQPARIVNVSSKGMAMVFEHDHGFKVVDELVIDLQLPIVGKGLQKQRYSAVAAEHDTLRCTLSGDPVSHETRLALRDVFRTKRGSLRRADLAEPVNGYAQALRRLYSHYHSQLMGYIAKEKGQYRLSTLVAGESMPTWQLHPLIDDGEARLRLCMQPAFVDALQSRFKTDASAPGEFYVLLVAKKIKGMDEVRLISKFIDRPCEPDTLAATYRNLRSIGPVVALQLSLRRFDNVNDTDYREELRYLARFAKARHQHLIDKFATLQGVFVATDLTLWLRERWPSNDQEPPSL